MPFLIVLFAVAADQLVAELSGRSVANAHATRRASGIIAAGIAVAALMIMSGKPWAEWVVHNAPLLDSDISRVETGIYIRDHTDAAAVVAAHAVGQISFYSNRRVIDLLGLSDPVAAKGPPVAPFRPGHNKWNYEYSIGSLKPDVIADEWGQLARFLAHEPEYLRLDNGIWVRKNSPHVYLQSLAH